MLNFGHLVTERRGTLKSISKRRAFFSYDFLGMIMMAQGPRSDLCVGDPDSFAGDMINLINAKDFSDIKFLVGEERQMIYAHKCILGARCEVFRAMFAVHRTDDPPTPLILTDIKPKTFLAILEFIYTNCCSLSSESILDVLAASIEYGLDGLTKICVRFMRNNMTIDTVCEYLQGALTYNQMTLQEECLTLIENLTEDVFMSRGFSEISEDVLAYILTSDNLKMDEARILEKVMEWINVNSVVTGSSMGEVARKVICNVRFPLLDPEKLNQIEEENKKKFFIPEHLISRAWKFHALGQVNPRDPQTCLRAGTIPRESLKSLGRSVR